jgi:hypothetical protein
MDPSPPENSFSVSSASLPQKEHLWITSSLFLVSLFSCDFIFSRPLDPSKWVEVAIACLPFHRSNFRLAVVSYLSRANATSLLSGLARAVWHTTRE